MPEMTGSTHVAPAQILCCSDRESVLETIDCAQVLAFEVVVTNELDEDSTLGFNVGLFNTSIEINPREDLPLERQIDHALSGFTPELLLERTEVDVEQGIADPRWNTQLMRMVSVWVEDPSELDDDPYPSYTGHLYLEVYDAPVPAISEPDARQPSFDFERGARAAAESMRFYFLDENEGSLHADLSTEILEQHEAGAVAEALADERRRLERQTDPEIKATKDQTRAALEKILDERFPRVQPHTPRSSPRRGDDAAVDARDDERWAISQFIDYVVDAGFHLPQQS